MSRSKPHFRNPKRKRGRKGVNSGMSAAVIATYPFVTAKEVEECCLAIHALVEQDPELHSLGDTLAQDVSETMVDIFVDFKTLTTPDVVLRISQVFDEAVEELGCGVHRTETRVLDAKEKTEEALRKAYRTVSSSHN